MPQTPKPEKKSSRPSPDFLPSPLDIVVQEGTVISADDERINGAIVVRQGVVAVETDKDTPDGIKTVVIDQVEAGEYFFEHLLFGFKDDAILKLRFRALKRTTIMVVTRDMLMRDPRRVAQICGVMLRTKNRELDRWRRREFQRRQEEHPETQALKTLNQELAENLETSQLENHNLQTRVDRLAKESRIFTSALDEAARENQELWRYVRTLERKAIEQEEQLKALEHKIETLRCVDAALAFNELTAETLKAQEATASAVKAEHDMQRRLTLMQRGFELLSTENPHLKMSMSVMLLLLGEEPENLPPSEEFAEPASAPPPSTDELDQVFEAMPISVPTPTAHAPPARRPQGLSTRITVPPSAKADVPARVPRPAPQRESLPEITFDSVELDTSLSDIVAAENLRTVQPTLLDPFEAAVQPAPAIIMVPTPSSRLDDATANPNVTRTWGAVRIEPPPEDDGDGNFAAVRDDGIFATPQVTQPYDVSAFRKSGQNKKDGHE